MASIVIVGGGAGGDATAFGLRRAGFDDEIVLISADASRPYERPLLSKDVLVGRRDAGAVFLRTEQAYEAARIDLRLGTRVVGGDRERRVLTLHTGDTLAYDTLVLATGSEPVRPPWAPGADNVHLLRTLSDAIRLRESLRRGTRLLIVGAGFLGCEVASSARAVGCHVTLCDIAEAPLACAVAAEVGARWAALHRGHGVDVHMRSGVTDWEVRDRRVVACTLADDTRHAVDTVLLAVGAQPELALARQLELAEDDGGVAVDDHLRAAPNIHCVGDIAAHLHPVYEERLRVEHWQVAQRQGEWCGALLAGATGGPLLELPWFWSDQYDVQLTHVGWGRQADTSIVRGDIDSWHYSVFALHGGRVVSVLGVNDARTVRRARRLISSRRSVEPADLADVDRDLQELAEVA